MNDHTTTQRRCDATHNGVRNVIAGLPCATRAFRCEKMPGLRVPGGRRGALLQAARVAG